MTEQTQKTIIKNCLDIDIADNIETRNFRDYTALMKVFLYSVGVLKVNYELINSIIPSVDKNNCSRSIKFEKDKFIISKKDNNFSVIVKNSNNEIEIFLNDGQEKVYSKEYKYNEINRLYIVQTICDFNNYIDYSENEDFIKIIKPKYENNIDNEFFDKEKDTYKYFKIENNTSTEVEFKYDNKGIIISIKIGKIIIKKNEKNEENFYKLINIFLKKNDLKKIEDLFNSEKHKTFYDKLTNLNINNKNLSEFNGVNFINMKLKNDINIKETNHSGIEKFNKKYGEILQQYSIVDNEEHINNVVSNGIKYDEKQILDLNDLINSLDFLFNKIESFDNLVSFIDKLLYMMGTYMNNHGFLNKDYDFKLSKTNKNTKYNELSIENKCINFCSENCSDYSIFRTFDELKKCNNDTEKEKIINTFINRSNNNSDFRTFFNVFFIIYARFLELIPNEYDNNGKCFKSDLYTSEKFLSFLNEIKNNKKEDFLFADNYPKTKQIFDDMQKSFNNFRSLLAFSNIETNKPSTDYKINEAINNKEPKYSKFSLLNVFNNKFKNEYYAKDLIDINNEQINNESIIKKLNQGVNSYIDGVNSYFKDDKLNFADEKIKSFVKCIKKNYKDKKNLLDGTKTHEIDKNSITYKFVKFIEKDEDLNDIEKIKQMDTDTIINKFGSFIKKIDFENIKTNLDDYVNNFKEKYKYSSKITNNDKNKLLAGVSIVKDIINKCNYEISESNIKNSNCKTTIEKSKITIAIKNVKENTNNILTNVINGLFDKLIDKDLSKNDKYYALIDSIEKVSLYVNYQQYYGLYDKLNILINKLADKQKTFEKETQIYQEIQTDEESLRNDKVKTFKNEYESRQEVIKEIYDLMIHENVISNENNYEDIDINDLKDENNKQLLKSITSLITTNIDNISSNINFEDLKKSVSGINDFLNKGVDKSIPNSIINENLLNSSSYVNVKIEPLITYKESKLISKTISFFNNSKEVEIDKTNNVFKSVINFEENRDLSINDLNTTEEIKIKELNEGINLIKSELLIKINENFNRAGELIYSLKNLDLGEINKEINNKSEIKIEDSNLTEQEVKFDENTYFFESLNNSSDIIQEDENIKIKVENSEYTKLDYENINNINDNNILNILTALTSIKNNKFEILYTPIFGFGYAQNEVFDYEELNKIEEESNKLKKDFNGNINIEKLKEDYNNLLINETKYILKLAITIKDLEDLSKKYSENINNNNVEQIRKEIVDNLTKMISQEIDGFSDIVVKDINLKDECKQLSSKILEEINLREKENDVKNLVEKFLNIKFIDSNLKNTNENKKEQDLFTKQDKPKKNIEEKEELPISNIKESTFFDLSENDENNMENLEDVSQLSESGSIENDEKSSSLDNSNILEEKEKSLKFDSIKRREFKKDRENNLDINTPGLNDAQRLDKNKINSNKPLDKSDNSFSKIPESVHTKLESSKNSKQNTKYLNINSILNNRSILNLYKLLYLIYTINKENLKTNENFIMPAKTEHILDKKNIFSLKEFYGLIKSRKLIISYKNKDSICIFTLNSDFPKSYLDKLFSTLIEFLNGISKKNKINDNFVIKISLDSKIIVKVPEYLGLAYKENDYKHERKTAKYGLLKAINEFDNNDENESGNYNNTGGINNNSKNKVDNYIRNIDTNNIKKVVDSLINLYINAADIDNKYKEKDKTFFVSYLGGYKFKDLQYKIVENNCADNRSLMRLQHRIIKYILNKKTKEKTIEYLENYLIENNEKFLLDKLKNTTNRVELNSILSIIMSKISKKVFINNCNKLNVKKENIENNYNNKLADAFKDYIPVIKNIIIERYENNSNQLESIKSGDSLHIQEKKAICLQTFETIYQTNKENPKINSETFEFNGTRDDLSDEYKNAINDSDISVKFYDYNEYFDDNGIRTMVFQKNKRDTSKVKITLDKETSNSFNWLDCERFINRKEGFLIGFVKYLKTKTDKLNDILNIGIVINNNEFDFNNNTSTAIKSENINILKNQLIFDKEFKNNLSKKDINLLSYIGINIEDNVKTNKL